MEQFKQENVDVIALSVDLLDKAKEMVQRVNATFPVAYGLQVPQDAEKVGAYWEERRKIIHATNFIIDSDRKVTQACYSTGPIGRIVAEDALRSIATAKKRKTASVRAAG
ncbi:MAG: redoxin domain-containing protein [Deltaproteobacteria bacterium]|nr:redoxin domain-containing protein [Deltaproteobacteria bacterium]